MDRRLRRYEVRPEWFRLFTPGLFMEILQGIPAGAQFCGFAVSYEKNCIAVFMEHESFDLVSEDQEIPNGPTITIKTYNEPGITVIKRIIESVQGEIR